MESILEQNTAEIEISFETIDGTSIIPSTSHYQLEDKDSGHVIIPLTSFTPTGVTYNLTVSKASNTIIDDNNSFEVRLLTVVWSYLSEDGAGEYEYKIHQLEGL